MEAAQDQLALPPRLAEAYEVSGLLGAGAFGRVLKAARRADGATVALKLLSPEILAEPRLAERFQREGRLGTQLASPHLVRTLDGGASDGVPYLVLEWIDGPSLEAVLEGAKDGLARAWALARVEELMDAVEAMHDAGMVHRDIKPANVLLRGGEQAVLADLGLARSTGELTLTRTGEILGSPAYMAPEQMRGEVTGKPQVDVYALGVLAFELLTGHLPFDQDNLGEMLAAKQAGLLAGLRAERVESSAELDRLMRAWLDPDPSRRPGDIAALRAAWKAALAAPTTRPMAAVEARGGEATAVLAPAPTAVLAKPAAASPAPPPPKGGGALRRAAVSGATALLVGFGFFRSGGVAPPAPGLARPALGATLDRLEEEIPRNPEVRRLLELDSDGMPEPEREAIRAAAVQAVGRATHSDATHQALAALVDAPPPTRGEASRLTDVLLTSRLVLRRAESTGVEETRKDAVLTLGRAFRSWLRVQDLPALSMPFEVPGARDMRRGVEAEQAVAVTEDLGGRWEGRVDPGEPPGSPRGWTRLPCEGGEAFTTRVVRSTWLSGTRFRGMSETDARFEILAGGDACLWREAPTRRAFPLTAPAGDLVLLVRYYGHDPTTQVQLTLQSPDEQVRLPLELPLVEPYADPTEKDRRRQACLVRVPAALVPPGLTQGEVAAFAVRGFATSAASMSLTAVYQQVEGRPPAGLGDDAAARVGDRVRALRDRLLLDAPVSALITARPETSVEDLLVAWERARQAFLEALEEAGLDDPEVEAFAGPLRLADQRAAGQVLAVKRLLEWRSKDPKTVNPTWAQGCMSWPLPGGPDGAGPLLDALERLAGAGARAAPVPSISIRWGSNHPSRFLEPLEQGGRRWQTLTPRPDPATVEGPDGVKPAVSYRVRAHYPDGHLWPHSLEVPAAAQGLGELLRDQAPGGTRRGFEVDARTPARQVFELAPLPAGSPLDLAVTLNDWPDGVHLRLGLEGARTTYELPFEVASAGRSLGATVAQGMAIRVEPEALPPGLVRIHLRAVGLGRLVRTKPGVGVGLVFQQLAGEPLAELGPGARPTRSLAPSGPRSSARATLVEVHRAVLQDPAIRAGLAASEWQDKPKAGIPKWEAGRVEFQSRLVRGGLGPALRELGAEPLGIPDMTRLGELELVHRLFSIHTFDRWKTDPARVSESLPWGRAPTGELLAEVGDEPSPGMDQALERGVRVRPYAPLTGQLPLSRSYHEWSAEVRRALAERGVFRVVLGYESPAVDFRNYVDDQLPTYSHVHRLRRYLFAGRPYPFGVIGDTATFLGTTFLKDSEVQDRFSPEVIQLPLEVRPRPRGLSLALMVYAWRTEVGWLELEGGPGTHVLRVPFAVAEAARRTAFPGRSEDDEPRVGVALWVHPDLLPEGLHRMRVRAFSQRAVSHADADVGFDEVFELVEGPPLFPEAAP